MSFLVDYFFIKKKLYCVVLERDLGGWQWHHVSMSEGGQACTEPIADVIAAV